VPTIEPMTEMPLSTVSNIGSSSALSFGSATRTKRPPRLRESKAWRIALGTTATEMAASAPPSA